MSMTKTYAHKTLRTSVPQGSRLTAMRQRSKTQAKEHAMYPVFRLMFQMYRARRAPSLPIMGTHVSSHICMPWDIDLWRELNNGRTLTVYDLGRIPLAQRVGLIDLLKRQKWGLTIAGSVVRYRRRIRMFDRIDMRSRMIGWDHRFVYIEQSMWKTNGDCASQAILRAALTDANGIVETDRILEAMGETGATSQLPAWVTAWIDAEAQRPWPPERPQ